MEFIFSKKFFQIIFILLVTPVGYYQLSAILFELDFLFSYGVIFSLFMLSFMAVGSIVNKDLSSG